MRKLFCKLGRGIIYFTVVVILVAPWLIAAAFFKLLGI